ncbi:MAG TPA: hypothetical protein VGC36_09885, partial [Rhizomicrobium sp.]
AGGGLLTAAEGLEAPLVLSQDATPASLFRIAVAAADTDQAVANEFADLCHGQHGEKWNKHTHKLIVEIGIEKILRGHDQRSFAKTFFDRLWTSQHFRDGLYRGLKEADEGDYARGLLAWHFYHAVEHRSYQAGYPHARAVGTYFAMRSLRMAGPLLKPGNHPAAVYDRCGFDLGLALHFVTDLTQPMHAANFTNLSSPQWRHKAFEEFVERERETILKNPPPATEADMRNKERAVNDGKYSLSAHLHSVATESHQVWEPDFRTFVEGGKEFSLEEPAVKTAVERSTALAPRHVALFVFGFVGLAERGDTLIDTSTWYRIREHTRGELMSWVLQAVIFNNVRRWPDGLGDNRHDFCFVPDGRGTYRIVGRHDPHWAWILIHQNNDIALLEMRTTEIARRNAFSVEFAGIVDGKTRVQFVEPTKLELISVSPTSTDFGGRGMRWPRLEAEADYLREQTYVLEPVGTMGTEERDRIAKIWADKFTP